MIMGERGIPSYVPFWFSCFFGWDSLKSQTLKMWLVYIQFLFGNEMPEKQTMLTVFFRGSSMFLFVGK